MSVGLNDKDDNDKKITKPNITQPLKNYDFSQFFGHNSTLGLDRDLTKNYQTSHNLLKMVIFRNFCHNTYLGLDRYLGFSRG